MQLAKTLCSWVVRLGIYVPFGIVMRCGYLMPLFLLFLYCGECDGDQTMRFRTWNPLCPDPWDFALPVFTCDTEGCPRRWVAR